MKKTGYTLTALTLLILLFFITPFSSIQDSFSSDLQATSSPALETTADYSFSQVSMKKFNINGHLNNQIQAKNLEHFKQVNQSTISQPIITIYNNELTSWLVSANDGIINHSNNQLSLVSSVMMTRQNNFESISNSQANATISTEQLNLNFEQNTAKTAQFITLVSGDSVTSAIGMSADLKKQFIQLEQQVKTQVKSENPIIKSNTKSD